MSARAAVLHGHSCMGDGRPQATITVTLPAAYVEVLRLCGAYLRAHAGNLGLTDAELAGNILEMELHARLGDILHQPAGTVVGPISKGVRYSWRRVRGELVLAEIPSGGVQ